MNTGSTNKMHKKCDSLLTITSIASISLSTMKTETKIVAKNKTTGLYFNGTNFSEPDVNKATVLPSGITSDSFRASWGGDVEVFDLNAVREASPNFGKKSFAQRIHEGEITRYDAAREYVREHNHAGQRSFSIRTASGEYISRIVKLEKTGLFRNAFINFCGNEVVVVWSRGELAVEWAA